MGEYHNLFDLPSLVFLPNKLGNTLRNVRHRAILCVLGHFVIHNTTWAVSPYLGGSFSRRLSASIALPNFSQSPCWIAFWADSSCVLAWPNSG
jgi:hypothetical protein